MQSVYGCGRYFEDDDEGPQSVNDLEYLPAPGSPTLEKIAAGGKKGHNNSDSSDEDDPLEAFMADIEVWFTKNYYQVYCFTSFEVNKG